MADIVQTTVFSTVNDAIHPFQTAPTLAAGAQNGGSPPAPTLAAGATDISGSVNIGSGSAPAAGAQTVVTFGTPWQSVGNNSSKAAPIVILTAGNIATAVLDLAATSITPTGFTISCNTAPSASQSVGTYVVNYVVLG